MELDLLLQQWEEAYKKGLLSFWILLLLSQHERYAYQIRSEIETLSQGSITADDNSIYRTLRRFSEMGLVESTFSPSKIGPARRYFHLTKKGRALLSKFIRRNILLFQQPEVLKSMEAVLSSDGTEI